MCIDYASLATSPLKYEIKSTLFPAKHVHYIVRVYVHVPVDVKVSYTRKIKRLKCLYFVYSV